MLFTNGFIIISSQDHIWVIAIIVSSAYIATVIKENI